MKHTYQGAKNVVGWDES